jgi:hypothetical protein
VLTAEAVEFATTIGSAFVHGRWCARARKIVVFVSFVPSWCLFVTRIALRQPIASFAYTERGAGVKKSLILTLMLIVLATGPAARQAPDECVVAAPPGQTESARGAIATVGLTDRVDPAHAPRPTNDSERLLFRQLYETLVRVDCMGRVLPGLAAAWRLDPDRRTWIVTLREDARFSDGTRVSPSDVRVSWTRDGDSSLRPEVTRLVESVTETDDRTLAIRLHSPRVDMPLSLAHPDLAIAKSTTGAAWPLGTRAGLVADGRTSVISLTRDNSDTLRFLVAPGDPRDLRPRR